MAFLVWTSLWYVLWSFLLSRVMQVVCTRLSVQTCMARSWVREAMRVISLASCSTTALGSLPARAWIRGGPVPSCEGSCAQWGCISFPRISWVRMRRSSLGCLRACSAAVVSFFLSCGEIGVTRTFLFLSLGGSVGIPGGGRSPRSV